MRKSSKTVENAGTYKKTSGKTNTALIEKMKADTANRTNQLRKDGRADDDEAGQEDRTGRRYLVILSKR